MQCSPSFLTATGTNKTTPLHVGTSYTHDIRFNSKTNVSTTHQIVWVGSLKPQTPPPPPPRTLYLGQSTAKQPSLFLAIFMGLSLKPIMNVWNAL